MTDMLSFLNDKLDELAIPYEFGEWTAEVAYPYFVGSFQETDFRYEDNRTDGIFTLDGWARDDKAALMEAADAIRTAFADLQAVWRTAPPSSCATAALRASQPAKPTCTG